jgi:hypothetical protein
MWIPALAMVLNVASKIAPATRCEALIPITMTNLDK